MTEEKRKEIVMVAINDSLKEYDTAIANKNKLLASPSCGAKSKEWTEALCDCTSKGSIVLANIALAAKLNFIDFDEYLSYHNLFTDIILKKGSD